MTVVGFNFTKINVERKQVPRGKIGIRNNINITNIIETDLSLGKSKETGLTFSFEFKSIYEPDVADITLTGDILYLTEAKKLKEVLDKWRKEKKVDGAVLGEVLNSALTKCNIQALILSQELNLPSPIPMPKLGVKKE
jgi:hypothetical protein